ncbi:MAG: hypothetical protein ACOCVR_00685, partial [Myxococcota bacterium]
WNTDLPWMVAGREYVEAGFDRDLGTLVLEEPALLNGKALGIIEGGKTVPLVDARIEVHARHYEDSYLLWEGRAAEDGSFQVALPTSLTSKVDTTQPSEDPDDEPW